jgi:hypothetical protein
MLVLLELQLPSSMSSYSQLLLLLLLLLQAMAEVVLLSLLQHLNPHPLLVLVLRVLSLLLPPRLPLQLPAFFLRLQLLQQQQEKAKAQPRQCLRSNS